MLENVWTWNMQGGQSGDPGASAKWNIVASLFAGGFDNGHVAFPRADTMCLQEIGSIDALFEMFHITKTNEYGQKAGNGMLWHLPLKKFAGGQNASVSANMFAYDWDSGGNRCNMAIVTTLPVGQVMVRVPKKFPNARGALIAQIAGGPTVANVHAISGIASGPTSSAAHAHALLRCVLEEPNPHSSAHGPSKYCVLGDFNCSPDDLKPKLPSGSCVCPPAGPFATQKGGQQIDYAVTDYPPTEGKVYDMEGNSDHGAVFYAQFGDSRKRPRQ